MLMGLKCLVVFLFTFWSIADATHVANTEVSAWSTEDVAAWVESAGLRSEVKEVLVSNHVTGNVLFYLDDEVLREDFGIITSLDRKMLLDAVSKLKLPASGQALPKLTFWEHRSANRKQVFWITYLISSAPRSALWRMSNSSQLQPRAVPEEIEEIDWLHWIFLPESYFYSHGYAIFGGLPGFMAQLAWIGGLMRVMMLVSNITNPTGFVKILMRLIATDVAHAVGSYLFMELLFPFVPWFICDLILWLFIYVLPLIVLIVLIVPVILGLAVLWS